MSQMVYIVEKSSEIGDNEKENVSENVTTNKNKSANENESENENAIKKREKNVKNCLMMNTILKKKFHRMWVLY